MTTTSAQALSSSAAEWDATLDRPIFVVGAPRSGTTLVQCILSANSGAYSLPETHFFSIVLPGLGVAPDALLTPAQLEQAQRLVTRDAELDVPAGVWERIAAHPHVTPAGVLLALFEAYRPADDAARQQRVIEKTPLHVEHLPLITRLFPTAKFVHVVRNPVDAVSSWITVPFASTTSVVACAQDWVNAVSAGEQAAATDRERAYTVVYERLVQDPTGEVAALCRFLGLEFQPRMLEEFGGEAARNVGKGENWKADVQRGVILNRDQIWRQRLTPGQAWLIERATASRRRQYGYAAQSGASVRAIAGALVSEARVRFAENRPYYSLGMTLRHALNPLKLLLAPR